MQQGNYGPANEPRPRASMMDFSGKEVFSLGRMFRQLKGGHLDGNSANAAAARVSSGATAAWLSAETSNAPNSQPTLGLVAATPKTVGVYMPYSRLLKLQTGLDSALSTDCLRAVDAALSAAVLAGTGTAGQPLGLINTSGVQTQSGTTLGQAEVSTMKKLCADLNAPEGSFAFVANPGVRQILEGRERAAGNGYVWENERVVGRPAYVSTAMPAASMVCGPWSEVSILVWGGMTVEINPFQNFQFGGEAARLLFSFDVVAKEPRVFCVASAIT